MLNKRMLIEKMGDSIKKCPFHVHGTCLYLALEYLGQNMYEWQEAMWQRRAVHEALYGMGDSARMEKSRMGSLPKQEGLEAGLCSLIPFPFALWCKPSSNLLSTYHLPGTELGTEDSIQSA